MNTRANSTQLLIDTISSFDYLACLFKTHPAPGLAFPNLANTFALILDQLRRAAAARLAANRAATPVLLILWARLHRVSMRFASLVARFEAGTLRPPRPAGTRPARTASSPRRLPTGFGWLTQLVPEARAYASQLQHLLSQPQVAALLDADPRFGRLLRPLCRILAIPLPASLQPLNSIPRTPIFRDRQPKPGNDDRIPQPSRPLCNAPAAFATPR